MISESDTEQCASEEAKLRRGGLVGPTRLERETSARGRWAPKGDGLEGPISVGEDNETIFIRV